MKSFRTTVLGLCAVFAASCGSNHASIKGVVSDAPQKDIVVALLDVNNYKVLDTLKTDKSGAFSYKLDVKKGDPDFIYLFYGDTKLSSLLVQAGDRINVTSDTLGRCTISGSEESIRMQQVEDRFNNFLAELENTDDITEYYQKYVQYYRGSLKYIAENIHSLTIVPVLYQNVTPEFPIFAQTTDALHFRNAYDSLKTVYPDSRYIQILKKETERRENLMLINNRLNDAPVLEFPELKSKDINGQDFLLSEVDAKVIMLQFWTVSDASHKLFNVDNLLPIYNQYHGRGFEIVGVSLDSDKATWATVVKNQKLPWINVNDGLGVNSPAVINYNVQTLPQTYLIVNGVMYDKAIEGDAEFKRFLDKNLK